MTHIVEHGSSQKRLIGALILGAVYLVLLAVGSFLSDSISLAANASHMLIHNGAIVVGIIATYYAAKASHESYSYRYNKSVALGGLINAILLGVMALMVFWHSLAGHEGHDHTFGLFDDHHVEAHAEHGHHDEHEHHEEISHADEHDDGHHGEDHHNEDGHRIDAELTLWVAVVGFIIHLASLLILAPKRKQNLCVSGAFTCIKYDVISIVLSIAVGFAVMHGASHELDLIAAHIIALMLFWNALKLAKKSGRELLGIVPDNINHKEIEETLLSIDHIAHIHNLIVKNEGSVEGKPMLHLSVHLEMKSDCIQAGHWEPCMEKAEALMKEKFGISKTLFQLERYKA